MPQKPILRARRDVILDRIVDLFTNVSVGGDFTFKWDIVTREPLGARELENDHVLGVWATTEEKHDKIAQVTQCVLTVTLGAQTVVPSDLDELEQLVWNADSWGNEVLLEIQLALAQADPNLDGLVISVGEAGNEIDLDGYDDKRVEVVVVLKVLYRHRLGDPRYPI